MAAAAHDLDKSVSASQRRMVRLLTLVGAGLSAAFALSHGAWPESAGAVASHGASLACAGLALGFLLLALFPRLFTLTQTVVVSVLATSGAAAFIAADSGQALHYFGLAFVLEISFSLAMTPLKRTNTSS